MHEQVATLRPARQMLWEAARPEASASPPAGGFYLWLPLPAGVEEEGAIALLAQQHQLLLHRLQLLAQPCMLQRRSSCAEAAVLLEAAVKEVAARAAEAREEGAMVAAGSEEAATAVVEKVVEATAEAGWVAAGWAEVAMAAAG